MKYSRENLHRLTTSNQVLEDKLINIYPHRLHDFQGKKNLRAE